MRSNKSINKTGVNPVLFIDYTQSSERTHAGRVLFIKDGCVFHQIYRGDHSREEMYRMISDALTVIQAQQGGEESE